MYAVYPEIRSSNTLTSSSQERHVASYQRNYHIIKISFPMFGKCRGNWKNIISFVVFTLEEKTIFQQVLAAVLLFEDVPNCDKCFISTWYFVFLFIWMYQKNEMKDRQRGPWYTVKVLDHFHTTDIFIKSDIGALAKTFSSFGKANAPSICHLANVKAQI